MPSFSQELANRGLSLQRSTPETLQLNVGKLCNLSCVHCHVNAGPSRNEVMTRSTIERILAWLAPTLIPTVDITGGAPEMIPDFTYLVEEARAQGRHIIDRCNLTILLEPGYEDLGEFLFENEVEIIASMPCYTPDNVDAQRGEGVFDASIAGLRHLNDLGYGQGDPRYPLHLVYNPLGATLPGDQDELEGDYKRELSEHFGITFDRLYTITNMPIARFASYLRRKNQMADYLQLLKDAFNPAAVEGLMCRNTLNVGWRGEVYDCDFNGMLDMEWRKENCKPFKIWEIDLDTIKSRPIATGEHCYGCTAGAGSSCGGALTET